MSSVDVSVMCYVRALDVNAQSLWCSSLIPAGPSQIALRDCAYGLARYAAIAQNSGLVPIVEPEVLLDGDQTIDR